MMPGCCGSQLCLLPLYVEAVLLVLCWDVCCIVGCRCWFVFRVLSIGCLVV